MRAGDGSAGRDRPTPVRPAPGSSRHARNSGSIHAFPIIVPRQLFWMLSLLWQLEQSETSAICPP